MSYSFLIVKILFLHSFTSLLWIAHFSVTFLQLVFLDVGIWTFQDIVLDHLLPSLQVSWYAHDSLHTWNGDFMHEHISFVSVQTHHDYCLIPIHCWTYSNMNYIQKLIIKWKVLCLDLIKVGEKEVVTTKWLSVWKSFLCLKTNVKFLVD